MPSRNIDRWLVLAGIIVTFDQVSKWLILAWLQPGDVIYVAPFFNWVLTFNPGAAFSFLSDAGGWQRWFFTALALGISAWIVSVLPHHSGEFRLSLALTLILGGALGNVIDRLLHGHVIDFLQLRFDVLAPIFRGGYFPAFNLADSAITLGAVCLILDEILRVRRAR